MGLSFGYGFQFALGNGVLLTPNAGTDEAVFASCPVQNNRTAYQGYSCVGCVDSNDSPVSNATNYKAISDTFRCSDLVAQAICATASVHTSTGRRKYGQFAHYQYCNCPVARMYKRAFLPDTPQWKWERN